eukprot:5091522-Amphidinium_carterae.2
MSEPNMAQVPDYGQPTRKMRLDRESIRFYRQNILGINAKTVDDGTANDVVDLKAFTPRSAKAAAAKLRSGTPSQPDAVTHLLLNLWWVP